MGALCSDNVLDLLIDIDRFDFLEFFELGLVSLKTELTRMRFTRSLDCVRDCFVIGSPLMSDSNCLSLSLLNLVSALLPAGLLEFLKDE